MRSEIVPYLYIRGSLAERFDQRVIRGVDPDECWSWRGSRDLKGYGRIWDGKRVQLAHRISWVLAHGSLDSAICVLHRCDNPPCANPRHLFLGTRQDNNEDARRKGRAASGPPVHRGEAHPRAKLTECQVAEIRRRYVPRKVTRGQLADQYGVSESTIKAIIERRIWR